MVQTRGYTDSLGDSSPGATRDHAVQRPPSLVSGGNPTRAGADSVVGCILTPNPGSGNVYVDAHLTGHRGPWGSCLQDVPPAPIRSLLVVGAAHTIQIPHLFLNIFLLHSSKSNEKP